jgi:hypothetical protein
MAFRITNLQTDLPRLNGELQRLDLHQQQIAELRQQLAKALSTAGLEQQANGVPNQNNIIFTWTGGTLTLSWAAAYVKDHLGHYQPIPAGSRVLAASTFYWAAWNVAQQSMSFQVSIDAFKAIPNELILCNIFTGAGGVNGTAGGGGSDSGGSGLNGGRYKLL